MSKLEDLRIEAGLSVSELSKISGVSRDTIEKVEKGGAIRGDIAGKLCKALSIRLERRITYKEAEIAVL